MGIGGPLAVVSGTAVSQADTSFLTEVWYSQWSFDLHRVGRLRQMYCKEIARVAKIYEYAVAMTFNRFTHSSWRYD